MNEKGNKRREWVKTAAIIFLSVMLVLTFFSNTIMNYSLPEVAAQYVEPGSITAKIRGNGVVESDDPYNVMIKETRKVASVAVRVGDQVQQGDVLVYLAGEESEELKAAQIVLKGAQEAYDAALLAADVNAQIMQNAESNTATTSYRQQITNAQTAVANAQKDVDSWQEKYDKVSTDLAVLTKNEGAARELLAAQNTLADIEARLQYQIEYVSGGDPTTINELTRQKAEAELNVINKQKAVNDAEVAYTESLNALTREKNLAEVNLAAANKTLEEKESYLMQLTADISKTLNLQSLLDAVVDAQEEVAKQEEKAAGTVVTADVAGTVTAINAMAGREVSALEPVAVLQPEGKGFTMSFSVTNEQAKRLSVGDVAELVNSWYYDDITVTLASIRPDPSEPGQKKQLIFNVSGNVVAGQNLNISVGQKSANFDYIVPNSAIREDSNGKFVLKVESKSSPLGNRYVATRVDVEVLASDDTKSAVRGALEGYEFIITTSNKPVEAGQLVRLPEN